MEALTEKLRGGDRRSIGRVDEVVAEVLADPALFEPLFQAMGSADPLVAMRAADAVEKVSGQRPDWLQPYAARLLEEIAPISQQEVRWHAAQMAPRLTLTVDERARWAEVLFGYLDDASRIVVVSAMQALADLSRDDPDLAGRVWPAIQKLAESGSPAIQARGRKLLRRDS